MIETGGSARRGRRLFLLPRSAFLLPLVLLVPLATAGAEPLAFFTLADPTVGTGRDVVADASESRPSEGATNITEYAWRWEPGGEFEVGEATARHQYGAAGAFVVTLRVTDDAGKVAFANQTVLVTGASPTSYFTMVTREERGGLRVETDAQHSSPSRGASSIATYEWDWGDGRGFVPGNASESHFYDEPGQYRIQLRVTDDQGRADTEGQTILVKSTFLTRMRVVAGHWEGFLLGARLTLYLAVVSTIAGFALAVLVAMMRISHLRVLRLPALWYIEVIRGTPLLLQILIAYLVLPQLGLKLSILNSALVALVVNTSAYQAEAMRAGIQAIPTGQMEAATSLGMTYVQAMRHIILPQAFRLTLPALGNEFIILLKDTSLAGVIGVLELTKVGQILAGRTFLYLEALLAVGIVYFAIVYTLSLGLRRLEKRLAIPGLGMTGGAH